MYIIYIYIYTAVHGPSVTNRSTEKIYKIQFKKKSNQVQHININYISHKMYSIYKFYFLSITQILSHTLYKHNMNEFGFRWI